MKHFWINERIKINHPMADQISVQNSPAHYCVNGESSELAFLYRGRFQLKTMQEFAEYAEKSDGDTRVYSYVPNELVESFLKEYRA